MNYNSHEAANQDRMLKDSSICRQHDVLYAARLTDCARCSRAYGLMHTVTECG